VSIYYSLPFQEGGSDSLKDEDEKEPILKSSSMPRSVCRELVLAIVQSLPGELIDQDTLGKVSDLNTVRYSMADSEIDVPFGDGLVG
jgi:hypothetical protein